jgi:hypothetical protein
MDLNCQGKIKFGFEYSPPPAYSHEHHRRD